METEQPAGQTRPEAEGATGSPVEAGGENARLARIENLLEGIVEHMREAQRERHAKEFGLADIFAALAQVVAIAAILGAVLALLKSPVDRGLAALSLLGAIAMQGVAMTMFMLKKRQ